MVKMMRKDQIERLQPESRIKNSYESLYYRADSGDPESDEIVREEIQRSFQRHGVVLTDKPDQARLRHIMLDAYKTSTEELGGQKLSSDWETNLTRDFDTFTKRHPSFYTSTFESYESRYAGEPVDLSASYDRMIHEDGGVDQRLSKPTEAELASMRQQSLKRYAREREMNVAGLSYTGHAAGVKTAPRRSFQQTKQEESAAQDVKGNRYDKQYDLYARGRGNSYQKTTAGDDYGFDEPEDDGPEL